METEVELIELAEQTHVTLMNFMNWAPNLVAAYPTWSWSYLFQSLLCSIMYMASHSWVNAINTTSLKASVSKNFLRLHLQVLLVLATRPTFYLHSRPDQIMGIRPPFMALHAKQIFKSTSQHLHGRNQSNVPKGHIAVYVGELQMQRKRFVVPISYLNHPLFLDLLNRAEEEFGFNHPMGGLTIPCKEDAFINLTSQLRAS